MGDQTTRSIETLTAAPKLGPIFAKAALSGKRRGEALPAVDIRLEGVRIDRGELTAYQRLCGFTADDRLPHTYPHVLGFGLQATVMSRSDFPMPMVGLVHLQNTITVHRALTADDVLDLTVRAQRLSVHAKGRTVDLVTEVDVAGERVWEGVSSYLARGGGDPDAPGSDPIPVLPQGFSVAQWSLNGDLGRRYAAVSGDINPIHLTSLTAKAMGFPGAIAHGMWSYARVLGALGPKAAGAGRSHVWFRKPIVLPTTVDLVVDEGHAGEQGIVVAGLRATRRPEIEHVVVRFTRP